MSANAPSTAPRTKRELGVESQLLRRKARREQFLGLHDFSTGRGLEIGPLDAGIADERVDDVRYVDVFDQAGIREHYADDPNVVLELIPDVHYPLLHDGTMRTLEEAAGPGAPYDWVLASHVIEHVPDVIGWLRQIAAVSADGARLLLAVPDRRYCFDRHRPPTTVGQALEAFEAKMTRPGTRALYDYFTSAVTVDTAALWRGERPPGRDGRVHDLPYAREMLQRNSEGHYVDCHVWTFTPGSLLEHVQELRALDLCDWYVERLEPLPGTVEFLATLRRLPRGVRPCEAQVDEPAALTDLPDWLDDEWRPRERVLELRQKLRGLRARNRRLRERLAALEGSTRLRVGSAVVAPLSAVRRRVRPRR